MCSKHFWVSRHPVIWTLLGACSKTFQNRDQKMFFWSLSWNRIYICNLWYEVRCISRINNLREKLSLVACLSQLTIYHQHPLNIPSVQKQPNGIEPFPWNWRRVNTSSSSCATWTLCRFPMLSRVFDIVARTLSLFFCNRSVRPETFCSGRLPRPLRSCLLLLFCLGLVNGQ